MTLLSETHEHFTKVAILNKATQLPAFLADVHRQSEEGQKLASRITALVNETLSEEASAGPNSLSQV